MKKIIFILITCLVAACQSRSKKDQAKQTDRPIITVTIEPLRYFTEAIAGDEFTVISMVPKGNSPETYDPTPQQLVDLAQSKAYFRIGYIGFERTWMDKLSDNAPHLQFFDMSHGVEPIYDPTHIHRTEQEPVSNYQEEESCLEGSIEPHIWNSAPNAQVLATNILNALCALDKEHKQDFVERYDSLIADLHHTDSLIAQKLATPQADHAFLIYHPALSYFARDYHLLQIPMEEGGKEPSPAHLKELIKLCKKEKVRVIFVQPEFDQRNAELIAQQTDTKIVKINPLSYNWHQEMLKVADALSGPSADSVQP